MSDQAAPPPVGPRPTTPPPGAAWQESLPAPETPSATPRAKRRRAAPIAVGVGLLAAALVAAFVIGRITGDPTGSSEYKTQAEKFDAQSSALSAAEADSADLEEQLGDSSEENGTLSSQLEDAQAQVDALVAELPEEEAGTEPALSEGVAIAPRNLKIGLKTRQKECFGSAGCNITVQVDPNYVGNQDASVGSWEITYEIRGGEDGPIIETMTLENGTFTFPEEQFISTSSTATELEAVVTEVYSLN